MYVCVCKSVRVLYKCQRLSKHILGLWHLSDINIFFLVVWITYGNKASPPWSVSRPRWKIITSVHLSSAVLDRGLVEFENRHLFIHIHSIISIPCFNVFFSLSKLSSYERHFFFNLRCPGILTSHNREFPRVVQRRMDRWQYNRWYRVESELFPNTCKVKHQKTINSLFQ